MSLFQSALTALDFARFVSFPACVKSSSASLKVTEMNEEMITIMNMTIPNMKRLRSVI